MRRVERLRALRAETDRVFDQLSTAVRTRSQPERSHGSLIHETAVIGPSAQIADNVRIGAFAIIDDGVVVGPDCVLRPHSIVRKGTRLGRGTMVDSFAVVGGDPQDLSFDPATSSGVIVGDGAILREGTTVHRSCTAGGFTRIGNHVTMMTNSHVGHDGQVDDGAILTNNVMLGGHVHVGRYAFVGGGVGVHQHTRIGEGSMIGGNASISYDVPPFTLAAERNRVYGLNFIGLKRRKFTFESVADLRRCYRAVFFRSGDVRSLARSAMADHQCGVTPTGQTFLEFFETGKRGFARPRSAARG